MSDPKMRKAFIQAKPDFKVQLSLEEVQMIQSFASSHYDGLCRQSAAVGGFLATWHHQIKYAEIEYVSATFTQLDLVMKITEMYVPGMGGEKLTTINNLRAFICALLIQANDLSTIKIEREGIR